jgi:uncharacterized protein (DUF983 family)
MISLAFTIGCLLLAIDTYSAHLALVRHDIFLVDAGDRSYQRPGNFTVMVSLLISFFLAHVQQNRSSRTSWFKMLFAVNATVYMVTALVLMVTSQLVGSNTGFVVTFFVTIATLVWLWRPNIAVLTWSAVLSKRRISVISVFRNSMPTFVIAGLVLSIASLGVGMLILHLTNLELHHFRIFGYSDASIGGNSLVSRFRMLSNNFLTQFEFNPMFGNLRVDELTTGKGTYAHSLISTLSHLGLLGTFFLAVYFFAIYRDLKRTGFSQGGARYGNLDIGLFRMIFLILVISFALIATFFTWMPLWFALGLLCPPFVLQSARHFCACKQVSGTGPWLEKAHD